MGCEVFVSDNPNCDFPYSLGRELDSIKMITELFIIRVVVIHD